SPDGKTIAYTLNVDPENPEETPLDPKAPAKVRVVRNADYKFDGAGYRGQTKTQVFTLDVASGTKKQLTSAQVDHMNLCWSPDGKNLAVTLWFDGPFSTAIALIDPETGDTTRLTEPDTMTGSLSWSPDSGKLFYDYEQFGYRILDVASKTVREVSADIGFTPDSQATNPAVWRDEKTVLVHGYTGTGSGLWTIDIETGTPTQIVSWDAIHGGLTPIPGSDTLLQSVGDLGGTAGVATIDPATGAKTLLFDEGTPFASHTPPAQWELISIERTGYKIEAILLKPSNFDARRTYPIILDVHGGPQGAHMQRIEPNSQVMASNGFLVLMPNPRGSTNYGREFSEAVYDDWGNEDWKDLQAILDKALELPYVDKDRTGIYGYSYGGYMTSWAIGHTDRFKAAVCGAPPFDLESMYGTSDVSYVLGHKQWGGTPWEGREEYKTISPSEYIHNATTPTLIVHGEADERCPIGQGEQMFISLKKLGVETQFVRYPGGSHGFAWRGEPAHRIDFYTRILAWFKKYLGDPV
ncbi:MAG TPA: S9 family peptidase, partial [Thermomicrobiales bacterium]|nr:S9 family peptidase [Thermomicrobiales bacterium]